MNLNFCCNKLRQFLCVEQLFSSQFWNGLGKCTNADSFQRSVDSFVIRLGSTRGRKHCVFSLLFGKQKIERKKIRRPLWERRTAFRPASHSREISADNIQAEVFCSILAPLNDSTLIKGSPPPTPMTLLPNTPPHCNLVLFKVYNKTVTRWKCKTA